MKRLFSVRRLVPLAILSFAFLAPACDEETNDPDAAAQAFLHILEGDGQTDRTGSWAMSDLVIGVRDILGAPLVGRSVAFSCDAPGSELSAELVVSDEAGLVSTSFRFGNDAGEQTVVASVEGDEISFTLHAVAIGCDEASLSPAGAWTPGNVFIVTTSSTLLPGAGSAVIEYDPAGGSIEKVVETADILTDLCFSPRGDLYVASTTGIRRVDPATGNLVAHGEPPFQQACDIEPNFGGVVAGIVHDAVFAIGCPGETPSILYSMMTQLDPEFLCVHPGTRMVLGLEVLDGSSFYLCGFEWNGIDDGPLVLDKIKYVPGRAPATPNGACVDDDGEVYVVMDDNGAERYVMRLSKHWMEDDWDTFDLYAHDFGSGVTPGRWGEAATAGGTLWLIDTLNDRLVWLDVSETTITWGGSVESTAFSRPGTNGERYGIAVAPAP